MGDRKDNRSYFTWVVLFILGMIVGWGINSSLRPDPHSLMLIGTMLVGGIIGGAVNYYLSKPDDPQNTTITKSVVVGVGASLLVPLFLNMLSSDLNKRAKEEPYAVLVFFGFCLIAAISSKAFITTLSERLLKDIQRTADEANEKANAAVESQTEPDPSAVERGQGEAAPARASRRSLANRHPLSDKDVSVLSALVKPPFNFRFLFGVTNDTGLDPNDVLRILSDLKSRGLVAETQDKENRALYYVTSEGRRALEEVENA